MQLLLCFTFIPLATASPEEVKILAVEEKGFSAAAGIELESKALTEAKESRDASAPAGLASWYGGKFQGRKTASGEIFDTRQFTAAHRTLPFGTMVRVVNLDNDRSTIVRINDRGPFVDKRIIDLSQAAALEIDLMKTGVARVSLEVLQKPAEAGKGFYRIQVASFKNRENAVRVKEQLKERGFSVYFESTPEGLVRVHIDNVRHGDLEAVKKNLRAMAFDKDLVRKIE